MTWEGPFPGPHVITAFKAIDRPYGNTAKQPAPTLIQVYYQARAAASRTGADFEYIMERKKTHHHFPIMRAKMIEFMEFQFNKE